MDDMHFGLDDIDTFIQTAFQQEPYIFKSVSGYDLLDWQDINHLLEQDFLDYPRIRLANDSNPAIRGYKGFLTYSTTVTGELSAHINRYNLLKNLQSGSTLIIDRCHAFLQPVREATHYISEKLRCRASANVYCAWSSTPSFGKHFDNHDVIAIQIEGSKRWDIYPPTLPYPLLTDKSFDHTPPHGEPIMSVTLSPGQAIYLPAGYWHNVSTVSDRSLHLSFPIVRPKKIDVIKMVLESLEKYPQLRAPVSYCSNSMENAEIHELINACLSEINIDDWESAIVDDCMQGRYIKFNLPSIRTRD
ncbi:cupin domain-containing protein [Pseudomonas sp. SBB6]|uniref:cupin domain-containing protein n=1 Tax=Pseudomonas sp. SBB6 TaxID=2962032 RepID=UPI0020B689F1|nr:cupin domain-containing protein [Pseudomonas sp. SBB6]MCP3750484.1 cupin domain-containing protein [Pseudomonas sp. SBB6]